MHIVHSWSSSLLCSLTCVVDRSKSDRNVDRNFEAPCPCGRIEMISREPEEDLRCATLVRSVGLLHCRFADLCTQYSVSEAEPNQVSAEKSLTLGFAVCCPRVIYGWVSRCVLWIDAQLVFTSYPGFPGGLTLDAPIDS